MATKHANPRFTPILLAYSLATLALVSSIPTNLRIQVNNENIQNAPYLLEAIKQIDTVGPQHQSTPKTLASDATQTSNVTSSTLITDLSSSSSAPSSLKPDSRSNPEVNTSVAGLNRTSVEEDYEDSSDPNSFSVVKEETIEEIVDLDPEIATKLTPSSTTAENHENQHQTSMGNSADMASAENHQSSDSRESSDAASADGDKASVQPSGSTTVHKHDRKPQLPVTSSHLKKPAYGALDDEQLKASDSPKSSDETVSAGAQKIGGGAKSLVSPSVSAEETLEPAAQTQIVKKMPMNLPDTLEPSQIMNGVTNASTVPGIVNKEYGHQTRTRITLGGGYVRDRLPPLVNPASDAYIDNKPEKPVTSLEKTRPIQENDGKVDGSSENRELDEEPATIAKDIQSQSKQKLGKLDSRCPKQGVTTLEHPDACDKYFYCEDGRITEYICPNGLMYGIRDIVIDYCVHRWKADCQDKSIPNPISSPGCRWQYGIFNVQGSPKCSPDYYECTAGKFEVKKCPIDGQIYDDRTKQCRYAEQVGCANEALADFTCPPDDQANTYWPFPRYFLNERALIHCVNDKPEIVRCTDNERVDPEHLHCVPAAKKPEIQAAVNIETRKARERKKNLN